MLFTYLFVMVLVLAGNAVAADRDWVGGSDSNLWNVAANWIPVGEPCSNHTVLVNTVDANCVIDATVDACSSTLTVGFDTGPCYLKMTGGRFTTNATMTIGDSIDCNGVFIMNGGEVNIVGDGTRLWIGYGQGSVPTAAQDVCGTLIMNGGLINLPVGANKKLELAKNDTGLGYIYMNGGDVNIGDDFEFANYGTGYLYMTGGRIWMNDRLKMAMGGGSGVGGGTARAYLNGGTLNCDTLEMWDEDGTIDITTGTLIVRTESTLPLIQSYVSEGWLTAYAGDGDVNMVVAGGVLTITAQLPDPNLAWRPRPRSNSTVAWTSSGPILNWTPGRYAADANGHDVYFGTSFAQVSEANESNIPPFIKNQDTNNYPLNTVLNLGQTYFWRIDENNDVCDPCNWKGTVWQFTMADYDVVETFNSYVNTNALRAVWKKVAGAAGSLATLETATVQDGNSMKCTYADNVGPFYTEFEANTTGPNSLQTITDWTQAGIKALVLSFYGIGTNSAEEMYVALRSGDGNLAIVYYDDPNDLNEPAWHEWNIDLADFAVAGPNNVNLSDVAKVYIGFGTRAAPAVDGTGNVYFDNIRLYKTRCVAALAPEGDLNADCNVDFSDVNVMATDWLKGDGTRKSNNGALMNGAAWLLDVDGADGKNRGWCVSLDGVNDWVDIDDSDFFNFRNKTIVFWVKALTFPSGTCYLYYFANENADVEYRIQIVTHTAATNTIRGRFVNTYTVDHILGLDVWNLLAFVIEDTPDGLCQAKFYAYNPFTYDPGVGTLVDTITGQPRHSGYSDGINIGSNDDGVSGYMNEAIDDFRVYDYNLTQAEFDNLAGLGGAAPDNNKLLLQYTFGDPNDLTVAKNASNYAFYHELLSAAELYAGEAPGSRVVNFKDFAVLASDWRQGNQFPTE
jgi:hypothetical protein